MTNSLMPFSDDSATATEALNPDNAAIELAANWNGRRCEKCEAPMKSDTVAICRSCGWYPLLNQFVDVDKDWEAYDDLAEQKIETPKPSHVEVWMNLLPPWAWVVIATVAVVVVESIAARLITADGSSLRTTWSLTQLVLGLFVFAGCHLLAFLFAVADDADTGALDMIIKPLKLWIKLFVQLPSRLWLTDAAAAGLTAAAMSVIVIGGLPYERLLDWGFKERPKQNLLGAIANQARQIEGKRADSLEDAVADFAGQQGLTDEEAIAKPEPTPPPKVRPEVDCVILGYRVDQEGRLLSLLLGTAHKGKLVYACAVSPHIDGEQTQEMLKLLAEARSNQPYVPAQTTAIWVKPIYGCRVTCESQEKSTGQLVGASWQDFLGKIR